LAQALGLSGREARAQVQLLLARALGISKARLVAHPQLVAEAAAHPLYREYLQRRLAGEPVAYILGEREFYGLRLRVTPAVLIPRPETELLVDLALARIPEGKPCDVLDIGTGSGCIAVAVAHARPACRIIATDVSEAALAVARENAALHTSGNVELRRGECFAPVAGVRFDLILSNPPYVAQGDAHLACGDLRFEPVPALVSGPDGLSALRAIIAQAAAHLRAAGWLLLEHGSDQGDSVRSAMQQCGYQELFTERDLAGLPRVSGCRQAGAPL
jgi:release factor glutamine methyltransferase